MRGHGQGQGKGGPWLLIARGIAQGGAHSFTGSSGRKAGGADGAFEVYTYCASEVGALQIGGNLLLRYYGACRTVADFEIAEWLLRITGGNHPHGTWPSFLPLLFSGRNRGVPFLPSMAVHPKQLHFASASVNKYHFERVPVRLGAGGRGAFCQRFPRECG